MPRTMSPAMLTAIQAPILRPAIFAELNFVTGPVYMWSGLGPITWNSHTWAGIGSLLGISVAEDGSTVEAKGITVTLSGIDPSLLADSLQEFQVGLPSRIYLGLFDGSSTPALIADPITAWAGKMDVPTIDVGGESAVIAIALESLLIEMNCPADRRYTLDDAQLDHPGDLGCMFTNSIQEITSYWGRVPSASTNV